jgi:hypothetical protein
MQQRVLQSFRCPDLRFHSACANADSDSHARATGARIWRELPFFDKRIDRFRGQNREIEWLATLYFLLQRRGGAPFHIQPMADRPFAFWNDLGYSALDTIGSEHVERGRLRRNTLRNRQNACGNNERNAQ